MMENIWSQLGIKIVQLISFCMTTAFHYWAPNRAAKILFKFVFFVFLKGGDLVLMS